MQPLPVGVPAYLIDMTQSDGGGNPENGRNAFARACASCHGDNGQGERKGADSELPSPGAINQPDFLALMSDQALRRLVITGRPDLGMPDFEGSKGRPKGFKPLTARDVADVIALLASWRRGRSASGGGN